MNQGLQVGFKLPYTINKVDTNGNVVPPATGDSCSVSSSDSSVLTIVPDSIAAPGSNGSGFVVSGTKNGTASVKASVTLADGTVLTGSADVDVSGAVAPGPTATGLSVTFGSPIPQ